MNWPTSYLFLLILFPAAVAFCRLVTLPAWKSVSIFLGVCGAMSSIGGLSVIADALLFPGGADALWLSPVGSLIDCAMDWAPVALCWYPATHAALSRQSGVAFSCELNLPSSLPAREMDVCVVLQNLLENALEASVQLPSGGYIRLKGSLHGDRLVLLTVENTYAGELVERDGALQSTKSGGGGIGVGVRGPHRGEKRRVLPVPP